MDCPTCEAMVDAYVDGELSATENAASYCGQYHAQPHTADIRNTAMSVLPSPS